MPISDLRIFEVSSRAQLKKFIHLPAKIHRNHSNWVPPIYMDDWLFFDKKKNESFSHCDTILLLAEQNGELVGRIMGIINHKYNQKLNERNGRFCFLETYDNKSVATALLKHVEDWALSLGMNKVVGPLGFSDKDPQGLLVEGYDEPNVIATNCNFPYLVDFVIDNGYGKELDLVVYKINIPDQIPEFHRKVYDRAIKNLNGLRVIHLKTKRQIKPYVRPVLTLMNQTFKEIYGFAELSVKEMDEFASRYIMVLDPRFLKIVENQDGEVIAFVLAMPDISQGVKRSKGYMLPIGILSVLKSQRTTKQLNLLLGAIRPDYQGRGIDSLLGVSLLTEAQKSGMKYIDSHLEMETNLRVRAEMERMGGFVYKRFRIFGKPI